MESSWGHWGSSWKCCLGRILSFIISPFQMGHLRWLKVSQCDVHPQKGQEDPDHYRPVSLTLVPGKVIEQIILSAITQHLQDSPGRRGLWKTGPARTTWSYPMITLWRGWSLNKWGKCSEHVYWDINKAFETFLTALSWRIWMFMSWVGPLVTGLKIGWMTGLRVLENGVDTIGGQ